MKFYLLKMNVCGIKNLDKEVSVSFFNKVLKKTLDFTNYNVKAIYGANGAGKTALIYAADIYKNFVLNKDYLTLCNNNSSLINLINQDTKTMKIEMFFAKMSDDNQLVNVFSHLISFYIDGNRCGIRNEVLKKLHGYRLNDDDKWEIVYEIKDGELLSDNDFLKDISKNVIEDRSMPSNLLFYYATHNESSMDSFDEIASVCAFAQSMIVLISTADKNYINLNYISRQIKAISRYQKELTDDIFNLLLINQGLLDQDDIIISKKAVTLFENDMNNFCKFIQVFKPDLQRIEIKKESQAQHYVCHINFVYKNGNKIARQYESTGIKKLMNIYFALCGVDRGKIVFIDEFDANIHDVVLTKLIEYILNYAKGQFVFTTHNLGPMEILQNAKCAIDFLSNDSQIVPWVKVGNSSAANTYRKGLIKFSPFNIESFSFLGVFGDE